MFTSDKRKKKEIAGNPAGRAAVRYTAATVICALCGAVYECFSHGVFSYYMIYAFGFPLVFGVLPYLLMSRSRSLQYPGLLEESLYGFGVGILTVGSFISGVLEIYGTESGLTLVYWIAGGVFLVGGAAVYLIKKNLKFRSVCTEP